MRGVAGHGHRGLSGSDLQQRCDGGRAGDLYDDADLLDEPGRALIRVLARAARLILVGSGTGADLDTALADRAGPCVTPIPLTDGDIAAVLRTMIDSPLGSW